MIDKTHPDGSCSARISTASFHAHGSAPGGLLAATTQRANDCGIGSSIPHRIALRMARGHAKASFFFVKRSRARRKNARDIMWKNTLIL